MSDPRLDAETVQRLILIMHHDAGILTGWSKEAGRTPDLLRGDLDSASLGILSYANQLAALLRGAADPRESGLCAWCGKPLTLKQQETGLHWCNP